MKAEKLNLLCLALCVLWTAGGIALFIFRARGLPLPLFLPIAMLVIGALFLYIFFEIRRLLAKPGRGGGKAGKKP